MASVVPRSKSKGIAWAVLFRAGAKARIRFRLIHRPEGQCSHRRAEARFSSSSITGLKASGSSKASAPTAGAKALIVHFV
jgi:hypothetical protein